MMDENQRLIPVDQFEWPKSFALVIRGRVAVSRDESIFMFRSNGRHSSARGDYYYVCSVTESERLFKFTAWNDAEAIDIANARLEKRAAKAARQSE